MAFINNKEIFDTMFDNHIVISYIGPFDGQILSLLASNIEDSLWEDPRRGKKFFKIFIELSQNIYLYSEEKAAGLDTSAGIGLMLIKEFDDHFQFITGNQVNSGTAEKLLDKCKTIISKDKDELREYKRSMRSLPGNGNGGGNIGLIQVALLSGYPIDFKFSDMENGDKFYVVSVRIDK